MGNGIMGSGTTGIEEDPNGAPATLLGTVTQETMEVITEDTGAEAIQDIHAITAALGTRVIIATRVTHAIIAVPATRAIQDTPVTQAIQDTPNTSPQPLPNTRNSNTRTQQQFPGT